MSDFSVDTLLDAAAARIESLERRLRAADELCKQLGEKNARLCSESYDIATALINERDTAVRERDSFKRDAERLAEKLSSIITAYDNYRGRGIAPAPTEYTQVVAAIDAARSQPEGGKE